MKKNLRNLFVISTLLFFACANLSKNPVDYVDPFIGTDGHGHTYPGASLPFGMVQLSPDTRIINWDACSGYHSSDNTIIGFSHTHLSGTGAIDYGDIRLMPTQGEVFLTSGEEETPGEGYRSRFDHATEKASPGFYAVKLEDYNIDVELTATPRTGMHKYIINNGGELNCILDLKNDVGANEVLESALTVVSENEIAGYRHSKGWANNQMLFFTAKFSKPFKAASIAENDELHQGITEATGTNLKSVISFDCEKGEEIIVKVALSSVSIDGAANNMASENPNWDFDAMHKKAHDTWNNSLSAIQVEGNNQEDKSVFYTALYHSLLAPNMYSDADMQYRGMDMEVHKASHPVYTVFSLWDTFRATHPLFTVLDPELANNLIKTMLTKYEQSGLLPVWELSACETGCMIGYHSIPVIADAFVKGIKDYDVELAFEAMKKSAMEDHLGLEHYKKQGFIPVDKEHEAVSKTLEYAYDDWCIAQIAKALNHEKDYKYFIERAQYYKNAYDASTGFMRGRKNGKFVEPFDPFEVSGDFTEANSWQYSYFAPQDISGLMKIMGGKEKFIENLDKLFTAENTVSGREQPDISGLVGQYAHGNEPSHHMAYLYNYAGVPWKTQEIVNTINSDLYTTQRDGLCGNEDCGQMSSWYVFSAMGFYPVTPGSVDYAIGTPRFAKTTINLKDGKTFVVEAKNISGENFYIQSAMLNGKELTRSYITHTEIMAGGTLVFEMGSTPNKDWAAAEKDWPRTAIEDPTFVPGPIFTQSEKIFQGTTTAEIQKLEEYSVRYTLDGSEPTLESKEYTAPFEINAPVLMKAVNIDANGNKSRVVEAQFFQIPEGRSITHKNAHSHVYTAGGEMALIDQQRGDEDFRCGAWQGWQGSDMDAVIDLGKKQRVNALTMSCLQAQEIWIMLPSQVEYLVSDNGKDFRSVGVVKHDNPARKGGSFIHEFTKKFKGLSTRYVQVKVTNFGQLPEWHKGAGGDAWIFADEITIK